MNIRVIPTRAHSAVDHVVGPAMIAVPEIFRLPRTSPEGIAPRAAGAAAAIYSNLTDYELSFKKLLPMRAHLALDAAGGAALAAIPWMTGARKRGLRHWLPHAALGAVEIAMAVTTKAKPPSSKLARLRGVLKLSH